MNCTDLDNDVLHSIGGNTESHSFAKIIEQDFDLRVTSDSSSEEMEPILIRHSSYHDFNQIVTALNNHKNKFSIFSTNIQSLGAKWSEFQIFVKRLCEKNCFFSA